MADNFILPQAPTYSEYAEALKNSTGSSKLAGIINAAVNPFTPERQQQFAAAESAARELKSAYLTTDQARTRATLQLKGISRPDGTPAFTEDELTLTVNKLIPDGTVMSVKDLDKLIEDLKTSKGTTLRQAPDAERQNLFSLADQWEQLKQVFGYFDAPTGDDSHLVGVLPFIQQAAGTVGGASGAIVSTAIELYRKYLAGKGKAIPKVSPDDAKFMTALASFQNRYIRDVSGATVTDGESVRMFNALVNVGTTASNFRATALQQLEFMKERMKRHWADDLRAYAPYSIPTMPNVDGEFPAFGSMRKVGMTTPAGSKETTPPTGPDYAASRKRLEALKNKRK